MTIAEYTVIMMKQHRGSWTKGIDKNGEIIIINAKGKIMNGVAEPDGTIISAETLLAMLEEEEA